VPFLLVRRLRVILFGIGAVLCAATAVASTLTIDIDRDGIRDVVHIAQAPAKPGLELWLSTTKRVILVPARRALDAVVAADLDADGWPELVATSAGRANLGLHVWRNSATGQFERLRRKHRPHRSHRLAPPGPEVSDPPSGPPTTVSGSAGDNLSGPAELSYFPFDLASALCTIPVQCEASPATHTQPRSSRAPPSLRFS
jgi:hypothetical protein